MASPSRSPATRRLIRRIRITGWSALSSLLVTIVGFLVWAATPYPEQPEPLRELYARTDIAVSAGPNHIVISPVASAGARLGDALLFFPGARVNPHAYATTFADTVAETGITVAIVRPWWNLAITDPRGIEDFQSLMPQADIVAVGGHSMGGVRACELAQNTRVTQLVLMASYCASDLSDTSLGVMNLTGSEDLLVEQEALDAARGLLPDSAEHVTLQGPLPRLLW